MNYISVREFAKKWNIPERTARNYCATGKIKGVFLTGKTWNIPEDAILPEKGNRKNFSDNTLLNHLKEQKEMKLKGGIYHRTQIDLTYNSNRIEESRLTQDQTRYIFETNTIGVSKESIIITFVPKKAYIWDKIFSLKSTKEKIKDEIHVGKKGRIVLPSDFEIKYGVENTKKSLLRLTNEGFLKRLARGIYLYPERDKLIGVLYPDIETIAEQIALRDNARIIPTGTQALNLLGLSTQVPLNAVFLTDGSPRTINIGKRKIKFKKTSPKNLSAKGRLSGIAIQALKEIGRDKVSPDDIAIIKKYLKKEGTEIIYHDMKLAPTWIAEIFGDLLAHYNE